MNKCRQPWLTSLQSSSFSNDTAYNTSLRNKTEFTQFGVSGANATTSSIPSSTGVGDTNTPTSSAGPGPVTAHSKSPVGAIAGGVVGGIVGLALFAGLAVLLVRRRQRSARHAADSTSTETEPLYGPHGTGFPISASTPYRIGRYYVRRYIQVRLTNFVTPL